MEGWILKKEETQVIPFPVLIKLQTLANSLQVTRGTSFTTATYTAFFLDVQVSDAVLKVGYVSNRMGASREGEIWSYTDPGCAQKRSSYPEVIH